MNAMKIHVILNPYARRWRAQAQIPDVRAAATAAGVDMTLSVTEAPRQATELARQAVMDGYDAVVAAGGDGTINEVINGVLEAAGDGPSLPFGIIPLGTANDFNLMAGLPPTIGESLRVIAAGRCRRIDAGTVNGRFFINNSAAAMEPMVTLENIKMKRLSGEARYIVALLRALLKLKPWQMNLRWDDGDYDGPAYLLSVCNSPRTGGFTMAPGAELDDGRLDMVFAPQVPRTTVLDILRKLMQGKHVEHPAVTFCRVTHIDLTSIPGTPLHSDGEIFTESAGDVHYRVLPGKVQLLSP